MSKNGDSAAARNEAKNLESDVERTVEEHGRDVAWNRPVDSPISGYQTTIPQRTDLRQEVASGAAGRIVAAGRENNANISRVTAQQALQRLGNFTTMLPDDFKWYLHQQIVNNAGVVPGVGRALLPSDSPFWEYAAKKEALRVQNDYEMFKMSQIDLTTPEKRQFWETRFPELTQKLRTGVRKQREERAKLEDIGLYGVQNEKDLWLLYKKERGFDNGILGLGQGMTTGVGKDYVGERQMGAENWPNQSQFGWYSDPLGNPPNVKTQTASRGFYYDGPSATNENRNISRVVNTNAPANSVFSTVGQGFRQPTRLFGI